MRDLVLRLARDNGGWGYVDTALVLRLYVLVFISIGSRRIEYVA